MIGTTQITSTTENGTFYCPKCDTSRVYRRRVVRDFITIYYLPLIPFRQVGEHLECADCKNTFDPRVLSFDKATARQFREEQEAQYYLRSMILVLAASPRATRQAVEQLKELFRQMSGRQLTDEQVAAELALARRANTSLYDFTSRIGGELSVEMREGLARAVFLVASADQELPDSVLRQLVGLPQALRIEEPRYRQLIQSVVDAPG